MDTIVHREFEVSSKFDSDNFNTRMQENFVRASFLDFPFLFPLFPVFLRPQHGRDKPIGLNCPSLILCTDAPSQVCNG